MTTWRDSPHRLADCLCSLLIGHAATRLFVPFSTTGSLQLPLSGVPPRLQRLDLMPDLQADRYVAPAVLAFSTPLAVRKSP
jgi:hypothetical protein